MIKISQSEAIQKAFNSAVIVTLISLPVLFSIYASWSKAESEWQKKALNYARDVQSRTDLISDQIFESIAVLQDTSTGNACSPENVFKMRKINLESSYIQAIGVVSDGYIQCSSLGRAETNWQLGPVDYISTKGSSVRANFTIPVLTEQKFNVVEYKGYAFIINKAHSVDVSTLDEDVSLASFSLEEKHNILASRGIIKREWLEHIPVSSSSIFFKNGYLVAIVKSDNYRTGSLAALPMDGMISEAISLAKILAPLGLISGLLLSFILFKLAKSHISMPSLLKSALRNNEFFMLYQPVVDLETGEVVGAEGLLRWRRPSGEVIPPDIFISVAEDSGLIKRITKRVLEMIGNDAHDLFRKHPYFHLDINLSAADLHSDDTLGLLNDLLTKTNANPRNIVVEATERGLVKANVAQGVIEKMRERGFKVALDDFGTGYSSLSYLESFSIDFLKIDKSFVDKIGTDAPTSQVVMHIIQLAKALNMKMVAEGVETEAQARFLRENGVQYAQGWLFGKPASMDELMVRLNRQHLKAAA